VACVFQLPFFDRWFGFMDEGHVLLFADIVASGGELYRDATIYPLPGAFYLLAGAFGILEPSILLSRWIVVIQFSVFASLVFVLLRRLVSRGYAILGVFLILVYRAWAFPHWQIYSYSTTALLLLVISMLLLLRFFETGRRRALALAGLCFGLGVLCKQDYGAAFLLAMTFALAVHTLSLRAEQRQRFWPLFVWFIVPAALVGVATGLHFLRQGLLGDLTRFTVLNHFTGMTAFEYTTFPPLFPLFEQDPTLRSLAGPFKYMPGLMFTVDWEIIKEHPLLLDTAIYDAIMKAVFYGPYLLLLAGVIRQWRRRSALGDPSQRQSFLGELLLLSLGVAFILLVTFNRPQDYLHLAVLYWPLVCLAVVMAHGLLHERRRLTWVLTVLLLLPAGVAIAYTGHLLWGLRTMHSDLIPGERGGVYALPSEARLLTEVVDHIRSNSSHDEPVAVIPYFPILQFLADRRGPHRTSYIVWPFPEIPDRDRQIIDAMETMRTRLLIYNYTQFLNFPPLEDYAPELFAYLVENFEVERVFTFDAWGYKLGAFRRSAGPEAGVPLLAYDGVRTSLRVEPDGGPPRAVSPACLSASRRPRVCARQCRYIPFTGTPFHPSR
jgi:hypothetical protein